jgi:hypothetical protein
LCATRGLIALGMFQTCCGDPIKSVALKSLALTWTSFAPTQIGPTARASRSGHRLALRWRGCGLGDYTIAGRSNRRFLSPRRRLLLGAGPENHPRRNNSEPGDQKQRRDRASHGTPPFTQGMDGTTEGAARQCGRSASRRKPAGERYREAPPWCPAAA